jgi:hypothetical protein
MCRSSVATLLLAVVAALPPPAAAWRCLLLPLSLLLVAVARTAAQLFLLPKSEPKPSLDENYDTALAY